MRDLYAFFPLAIRFAELHKLQWIKENNSQAELLYHNISEVFNRWMRSQHFKREELNFLSAHDVDVNALISAGSRGICRVLTQSSPSQNNKAEAKKRKRERKEKGGDGTAQQQSLIVVCLKRVLPVGLNLFTGREQELVQKVKERMLRNESNEATEDFVKAELTLPDQPDLDDKRAWQRYLYIKIGKKKLVTGDDYLMDGLEESSSAVVEKILAMSKVLHGLHLVSIALSVLGLFLPSFIEINLKMNFEKVKVQKMWEKSEFVKIYRNLDSFFKVFHNPSTVNFSLGRWCKYFSMIIFLRSNLTFVIFFYLIYDFCTRGSLRNYWHLRPPPLERKRKIYS